MTALVVVALVMTTSIAGATPSVKFQVVVFDDSPPPNIHFTVGPVPAETEPVNVKVGFANNSIAPHVLVAVGGLPAAVDTVPEFITLIDSVEAGAPPPEGAFEVGAIFSKPGQDHQKQFDLTALGQYGFFCPIVGPTGIPHYKEGFVGLFKVVPSP